MHRLFEKQRAAEQRRLLNFVVSNSLRKGGEIVPVWRQPSDMIAVANQADDGGNGDEEPKHALNEDGLPFVDSNRAAWCDERNTFVAGWSAIRSLRT